MHIYNNKDKLFIFIALLLLTIQIFLGVWTSTNYAAYACGTDFPFCLDSWWPEKYEF